MCHIYTFRFLEVPSRYLDHNNCSIDNKFLQNDLMMFTLRFLPGINPVPCDTTIEVSASENFELSLMCTDTNPDDLFMIVLVLEESMLNVCLTIVSNLFLAFLRLW